MYNSFPVILLISSYPTHFPFACIGCDIVCGMGRGIARWDGAGWSVPNCRVSNSMVFIRYFLSITKIQISKV